MNIRTSTRSEESSSPEALGLTTTNTEEALLRIPKAVYEEMRQHGEETYPHECCGVLLGVFEGEAARAVSALARTGNTRTDSPENRYNIDPRELVKIQRE